jgi:hypothetical protein
MLDLDILILTRLKRALSFETFYQDEDKKLNDRLSYLIER